MVAPTLATEEYQYDDSGVKLNSSPSLPFVDISSVEGLDAVDLRTQSHDAEGMDGGYVDAFYEGIRTVSVSGTVYASPTALDTYLDQLKANFAPSKTDKPFYFMPDTGTLRCVYGKSLGFKYPKDDKRRTGMVDFQFQIMCQDPRVYEPTLLTGSRTGSTGTVTVTPSGNRETPGTITITGPITSPTVTHSVSGTVFSFSGYTLAAGNTIVIDLLKRTVLQNGTTNKRNVMTMTGNWYLLSVGTNTFTLGGSGLTAASGLSVQARSAWR